MTLSLLRKKKISLDVEKASAKYIFNIKKHDLKQSLWLPCSLWLCSTEIPKTGNRRHRSEIFKSSGIRLTKFLRDNSQDSLCFSIRFLPCILRICCYCTNNSTSAKKLHAMTVIIFISPFFLCFFNEINEKI